MKQIIFFFLAVIFVIKLDAQTKSTFSLVGIVSDSSIKKIEILFIKTDTNFCVTEKIIEPSRGKFKFTGKLPYTYAVYLRFNNSKRSELLFLDGGTQRVFVKSIDSPLVVTGSKSTFEYRKKFLPQFDSAEKKHDFLLDELNKIDSKAAQSVSMRDSITQEIYKIKALKRYNLYEYTKEHPDSYVAFWDLFFNSMYYGYHQTYRMTYALFSKKIETNPIGLKIKANLDAGQNLNPGNNFPELNLIEYNSNRKKLLSFNSKYTLVDFWFSNCSPCRAEFPDLKEIYQKYKSKGFEIISISIDSNIELWKNTIKELELPWQHFVDIGGHISNDLIIYAFPTTFLLDEHGKIIKKNVTLFNLDAFMNENCN